MFVTKDKDYKIVFLDTNALRYVIQNTENAREGFHRKFIETGLYVPCFSMYNVIEIHRHTDIYEKFLDYFDIMSSFMTLSVYDIFKEEHQASLLNETMAMSTKIGHPSSPFFRDENNKLRAFLETSWQNKSFTSALDIELNGFKNTAQSWTLQRAEWMFNAILDKSLTINQKWYLQNEEKSIKSFLPKFGVNCDGEIDIFKLPAVRVFLYSQFMKVHMSRKEITKNDCWDVSISAIVPYCEAVITERSQAEVFKQAKRFIPQMKNLEVYTVNDLLGN